jgi:TrmH family RNA methyltransferase
MSKSDVVITSPSNQTIKDLVKLKNRKGEESDHLFLVEGVREGQRALSEGFLLKQLFICAELLDSDGQAFIRQVPQDVRTSVSRQVFAKAATREASGGILTVFEQKKFSFADIFKRGKSQPIFLVVVENLEKPGNLGAILRTADGADVHGVIILGATVDVWNPNVIRSSLGAVFSVPTLSLKHNDFFEWCRDHKIKTVAAALSDRSGPVFGEDLASSVAIIVGSEAHGLSDVVLEKSDRICMIPMLGICDSLNVSVAAGVLMYETLRQRSRV